MRPRCIMVTSHFPRAAGTSLPRLNSFLLRYGQPVRQRLTRIAPHSRNTLQSDSRGDNATNHRRIGINVAKPPKRCPDRLFEIMQMMGGAPEDEGHSILSGDTGTVADACTDLLNGEIIRQIPSHLEVVAYLAGRD